MNYLELFTPHHIATITDWLAENGKLSVRLEWPHRGQSGSTYTVASIDELRELISQQTHPEIKIWIFKKSGTEEADYERMDDETWVYNNANQVIFFSVTKNRNHSESYAKNPKKYESAIKTWTKT
jgi:hypothetical protein